MLAGHAARADVDYRLGNGLDLGRFNLAGYSNLVASAQHGGKREIVLDDLSLFVTGHVNRWINPFAEAELTNLPLVQTDEARRGGDHGEVLLERLYNDVYLSDAFTLRLGKMLAPVGQWNEIHANPLVLSTVRPAVTFRNFSEFVTGVSLNYSDPLASLPDVRIYWQPGDELSERPGDIAPRTYTQVAGLHVSFPIGLLDKVGFSFQATREENGVNQQLAGLDFHYSLGRTSFQGEATVANVNAPSRLNFRETEIGAYAAASYAVSERLSVHAWYEGFADRAARGTAHDVLVGITYKNHPASVFKLEYLQNLSTAKVTQTGLFASWSVLF